MLRYRCIWIDVLILIKSATTHNTAELTSRPHLLLHCHRNITTQPVDIHYTTNHLVCLPAVKIESALE
ncbi:hypothetical protein D3C81_2056290 [compost metagenome]